MWHKIISTVFLIIKCCVFGFLLTHIQSNCPKNLSKKVSKVKNNGKYVSLEGGYEGIAVSPGNVREVS